VTTVLLVRHGRTTANASGVLAGWSEGVDLDAEGQEQARRLRDRWASLRLDAVVSSPLQRCRTTAELARVDQHPEAVLDEDLGECHYGEWTGRTLASLAKDPLWKVVQQHPSAATFPGGESLRAMQSRSVDAIRRWNAELPRNSVYAVFSHGDVIKAILADALGLHLDQFQRLVVDPGSVSVIRYSPLRPFVERTNSTAGDLAGLRPAAAGRRRRRGASSDAAVGGGDGHGG
jgi:probable phosphomutase (TIGR03848 family)